MFDSVRKWLDQKRWRQAAIEQALAEFGKKHRTAAMGAHVLRLGANEGIVRVMYISDHIPPDRAWYAVSRSDSAVRELSFDDVADVRLEPSICT